MVASSREALAKAQLSISDIDYLIPHQANGRITAAIAQQLGVPVEKVASSIAEFGNSSAATIPLTLSLAAGEGRMARGQRLLMCAAGAGLTGGAVVYAL
jgi:3-oxoacyl-[acyl-carrier-protein] synthase III